jgi:sialidase-1
MTTISGPDRRQVFVNGDEGYACYRIPGIVRLGNGQELAVAEGRRDNCLDHGGVIRVVGKIGSADGASWGPLFEIARNVLPDGEEQVAQNPAPVLDLMDPAFPEGKVIVMFNKAESGERDTAAGGPVRRTFVIESHDHGQTWVNERDITTDVHRPLRPGYTRVHADAAERYANPDDWRATFPPVGHAIQLRGGIANRPETRGRLFFAAYTTVGERGILEGQAYAIWSDDHGATWRHSDPSPVIGPNEAMAVELEDGSALVNFRNYATPNHSAAPVRGQMMFTFDETGAIVVPATHTEPPELTQNRTGLQGSIHRLGWSDDAFAGAASRILFSGANHPTGRRNMTVWLSEDEGQTWPVKRLIDPGPSAYGDLTVLDNGRIGLLYERGNAGGIDLVTFPPDWLSGATDQVSNPVTHNRASPD